ncbi:MAG TPA: ABC transporter permease [Fodinibius sp.]|nr:ABC transporter permease [Fodinibius sp.]
MSIQKIFLVLKREYITRLRSKGFLIATLLIPLGMIAFIGVMVAITTWDTESQHRIGIADHTETIYPRLEETSPAKYRDLSNLSKDSLRSLVLSETIDGYVTITDDNISDQKPLEYISSGSGGLSLQSTLKADLRRAVQSERLNRAKVSEEVRQIYDSNISMRTRTLSPEGTEKEANTGFLSIVGLIMGVIIFSAVIGYGGMLTRSVIEEKTNRIIEIITSSVKPIELLLGKMAGVGALGITQLGFWIATFFGLAAAAGPIISMVAGPVQMPAEAASQASGGFDPAAFNIPEIAPSLIIYFVLFFILGYLLYSSLFAAIGAAVDSETDTQQFMFPIMIPIMIGYFIMIRAMSDPDSTLAVVGSLIPFCTPIVMITRIAITDVPFWQIGLSIILMLGTFAVTMWLSAKIYSVGILSYGNSANFKELWKWIREG